MIHRIPHFISAGLRKENEAHAREVTGCSAEVLRLSYPTAESYANAFLATAEGMQFAQAMEDVPAGKRILDIGAGFGRSTIYLLTRGYQVVAVEPAPAFCEVIDRLAAIYGYSIDVYQTPAEAIDQLSCKEFDVCIFNASLHHCDDPIKALRNCHRILASGGQVFLLNEPQLHYFRSKRWFEKQLQRGTMVAGDYGGNEHIYYYHEYHEMLRQAGFVRIQDHISNRYLKPDSYLHYLAGLGRRRAAILSRRVYYSLIRVLQRGGFPGRQLLSMLKKLSLVQTYFTAWQLPDPKGSRC